MQNEHRIGNPGRATTANAFAMDMKSKGVNQTMEQGSTGRICNQNELFPTKERQTNLINNGIFTVLVKLQTRLQWKAGLFVSGGKWSKVRSFFKEKTRTNK